MRAHPHRPPQSVTHATAGHLPVVSPPRRDMAPSSRKRHCETIKPKNSKTASMIYIVIPCYNEQEVLEDTTGKLASLIATMEGEQVRILYTDDGSRDATWALIGQMHDRYPFVEGVRLAHNVGHQRALWAGMEAVASRAEAIVSIDADLQDDIRVIPRMVACAGSVPPTRPSSV